MTCPEFHKEFDARGELSRAATDHIRDCAGCEKLHRQQTGVWRMIDNLPKAAAPDDFNFKVRSRLAVVKASDLRPAWWKSLRYVAPAFTAVFVLTLFLANQNFFISTPPTEQIIVQNNEQQTNLIPDTQAAQPPAPETVLTNANYENVNYQTANNTANSTVKTQKTPAPDIARNPKMDDGETAANKEKDFSGSRDLGVKNAPTPTFPIGIPNEFKPDQNDIMPPQSQNVRATLAVFGAETSAEDGGLRVVSVKAGSPVANAGLKTGDLIQAVDGKNPLTGSLTTININTLTVRRGDQKITILIGLR